MAYLFHIECSFFSHSCGKYYKAAIKRCRLIFEQKIFYYPHRGAQGPVLTNRKGDSGGRDGEFWICRNKMYLIPLHPSLSRILMIPPPPPSSLLPYSFCSYFMLFSFNFPAKLCTFSLPQHSFHQGARFFHALFQFKQRAAIASVRHWVTRLTKTLIQIFYCIGNNTVSFSVSARRKKGLLQYNILLPEFLYNKSTYNVATWPDWC